MSSRPPEERADSCNDCSLRLRTLCGAVGSDELADLERIAGHMTVPRGRALYHDGDPADHVYIILKGAVRLVKMLPDGRRQITEFLFDGDFLGLNMGARYVDTAEAITTADLCRFRRADYEALVDRHPQLSRWMLLAAYDELAAAQNQIMLLGRKCTTERLASFLVWMAERHPANAALGTPASLVLPMNRRDIADYLGLTIETVSRTFTWFANMGIIGRREGREIAILAPDRLEALANGEIEL